MRFFPLRLLLAVVPALPAVEAAAEDLAPPPFVLVLRTGALAREEISPGSRSAASETWSLAAAGVALTNIQLGDPSGDDVPLERWKAVLLPEPVLAVERERDEPSVLVLDLDGATREAARKALDPPGLEELRQRFGIPPARGPEEDAALEAIDASVGGEPSLAALRAAEKRLPSLEEIPKAKVSLVRIAADGGSTEKVLEREGLLRRILRLAGEGAHVIVLNAPSAGAGSAFARGPRLKAGRIFESPRTLKAVSALISALTGSREEPEGTEAKEPEGREEIHDLLR